MSTIRHDRFGSGEPLILVHGVGSRRQVWGPIIPALANSFEVIAVDLPGFGESEPLPHTSVATLTDALAGFLIAEGIERPHLAGNSMGGGISLELGARGLARSVTAYSPIGFWDTAGRIWCQQSLGKSKALGGHLRSLLPKVLGTAAGRTAFLSLVVGKPWALDTDIAIATALGAIDAPGFDDALASFTDFRLPDPAALAGIPVTIAWGNRDILLTYATQARRAKQYLPGAKHITLHGIGHTPFYDDPDACAQVLLGERR
ncbi:alpha/beta hydrolase [Nocardia cyriacigeorgica]|uniref:Alpha/beta hydrolase n=1 Tax=Nocardia cyriacigeorgica TaxID=135487 RepID=A0A6P1DD24_9NOCA|nr:alpha/beta hydrolase [Nocardia cyriacigeorgica]NEW38653.1 alpha/beta hydrolase [Nocardia cyriacigeorgica]NEW46513.1 alpha/beta hydrolase [Nocardia cyriacigeorgica]NEW53439.1 alpha/beta hydrolase [Nocardia cyriacigeorgica]NEW58787.1 alpha/beta hydrolase [Nocardia cyriacigeorgica]